MYSTVSPVYQKTRLKDGTYQLKIVAETDHVAAIQSHRDEVDLHQLLKKASITGDYSRIRGNNGVYADIASLPRSFNEAQKLASSLPDQIKKLPDSVKAAFSSYEDFVGSVVNGTTQARVNAYISKSREVAAKAVAQKGDNE